MKFLREPLVHFLTLGAGLFLLFALVADDADPGTQRIEVSAGRLRQMSEAFARTWQRPPTREELDGLIEDYVRDEIYYREARAMGLDVDDTIVRRRLRQKLEFITEDLVDAAEPDQEQLSDYLRRHPEAFRRPARYSFRQIHVAPEPGGKPTEAAARELLARLQRGDPEVEPVGAGSSRLLPAERRLVSLDQVAAEFGGGFAAALPELPEQRWAGPVESGYGLHVVKVNEVQPAVLPELAEIRAAVEREFRSSRRREAEAEFYAELRRRYQVVVASGGPDVEVSAGNRSAAATGTSP